MNRYFLNFSYVGTSFRGLQRVITKNELKERSTDIHSVQGVIELALRRLKPENDIDTAVSSRTDAGVHALHNTLHVDLQRKDNRAYNPDFITYNLNNIFYKYEIPIRIHETYLIPPGVDFHCRHHAIGRTYLYRLAVIKPEKETPTYSPSFIPIEEADRCFFLQKSAFDFEAVREVLPLFRGTHDFRTFMGLNETVKRKSARYSVRTISDFTVERGRSQATVFNRKQAEDTYDYFDIQISARSFLYRQVRRMVGTLLAVAHGKLTPKDVYELVTVPSSENWPRFVRVMPANGLYLCQVKYEPALLEEIRRYNEPFREAAGGQREATTC